MFVTCASIKKIWISNELHDTKTFQTETDLKFNQLDLISTYSLESVQVKIGLL